MTRNLSLFIAVLFIGLGTFAQDEISYSTIYPGEGIGDIKLNVSTIDDVVAVYGKKYKKEKKVFSEYSAQKKTYITTTYFQMIYKKQGLIFHFGHKEGEDKEKLTKIEISAPFAGKTKKGITLGQSTFEELIKLHGNKEWTYSQKNKRVSKIYKGILYSSTVKKKIPPFDNKVFNEMYKQNVIDYIMISAE